MNSSSEDDELIAVEVVECILLCNVDGWFDVVNCDRLMSLLVDTDNVMGYVVLVVSIEELLVHAISVISARGPSVEGSGSMMKWMVNR